MFQEGVEDLKDLTAGMVLEGVVTNVTNFGVFVDVGVHQDGLVHISMMSERFIKDPRELVKAGDVVKVKVLEVDLQRRRIALTLRLGDSPQRARPDAARQGTGERDRGRPPRHQARPDLQRNSEPQSNGVMADALKRALKH